MNRTQVFVSYSHRDRRWLDDLQTQLKPYIREQDLSVWDDSHLKPGDLWAERIEAELQKAKVAVLLVTANYLASPFIASKELPPILAAQAQEGLRIVWIPASASAWSVTPIKNFHAVSDPARPLDSMTRAQRASTWVAIANAISTAAEESPGVTPNTEDNDNPIDGRVVIVYKRGAPRDEQLLALLEAELKRRGFPVWIDRHLRVGMDWAKTISDRIEKAWAVIPLLSESSVSSEMFTFEVQVACRAAEAQGHPSVLPVRVGYDGMLRDPIDILDPIQHAIWRGPHDTEALFDELVAALNRRETTIRKYLPPPGGALSPKDPLYILRPTDGLLDLALERQEGLVLLVSGARQMGKTSLVARGLQQARDSGARTAYINFQKFNNSSLTDLDSFYRTFCEWLEAELRLTTSYDTLWKTSRSLNMNLERVLQEQVLPVEPGHLVCALDETERLFEHAFASEFFALIRSWHNERQAKPESAWGRLTVIISYATEPHLFIKGLDQSPFNVGVKVELTDFTPDQVEQLNVALRTPLRDRDDVRAFHWLVGGQPYLVRRGLYELSTQRMAYKRFEETARRDDGPFGDHLRRLLVVLARSPELEGVVKEVLRGRTTVTENDFFRLRRAGILSGGPAAADIRCDLYRDYLTRHVLAKA